MLVAPLIMDGPQACSRWARQPQPQLRHFKKPSVGPLPSPSSHTGRSEAPENSETSPREKGNLGLPVLLTDGSTHLEQIVGSDQALLCRNATFCGVKSGARRPADAQDASVKGKGEEGGRGPKVTGADDLFSTTQGCRVLLRRALTLQSRSSASGVLEVGYRGRFILMCLFFWADGCEGKHGCVGGGASTEIKKRVPTFSHNPLA